MTTIRRQPLAMLRRFFALESAGGLLLIVVTVAALVCQNSPLSHWYDSLLHTPVTVSVGEAALSKSLVHWINDGLMTIFFLLVGLELKREMLDGVLSTRSQILLPGAAAAGGMLVPALVYVYFNLGDPTAMRGWAIPTATDIAFSLGVLSLFGAGVPIALKVFLTALAIFDDLGAIIVIAIFYTAELSFASLALAALALCVLAVLNRRGVATLTPYALLGIFLWLCVLKSGVHATLAGVALAFAIPLRVRGETNHSPLHRLETALHPWVAFGVLPVFAFANAGVSIAGMNVESFTNPISLGILLGLFFGKQIGVFLFSILFIRAGWAKFPEGSSPLQFYGVCVLTGIGFTMSLFIGALAFVDAETTAAVRVGVLAGSFLSAVLGAVLLRSAAAARG